MAKVILNEETIQQAFEKVQKEISLDGLKLCRVTEEHYDAVLDFVGKHFVPDEPLTRFLGIKWNDELSKLFKTPLQDNVSLMAVSDSGDIADIRIIHVLQPKQEVVDPSNMSNLTDNRINTLMTFINHKDDEIQMFTRYGVSEMWHFLALATNRLYRRRGIGTALLTAGVRLGKELGYQAVKGEGTSNFSQRIYERVGFDLLDEFLYDKYKIDGEVVFKNMGEHKSTRIYGMQL